MQCTSPIVNFAPSEAHEKVDDQSIKQSINQSINQSVDQPVNQLPIRKSSISSSPFLKISQSISQFAPTVLPSKINYQSTIFPLSPQLTNSPLNRSINQSKCQSPSFSSFKLEPAANIPTLDQSISQTLTDHSSIDQSTNHTLEADTKMQRVHREKSIRSPMTKRLSRSINQSTNESTPFSPAGEPITVEFPIDDSVNQSIIQSRNQSFNKELDESLNHVSLVKTDTSPTNQSISPSSNQSPDQLISPSKVDHLLKEVDGALFGSSSMANEVAQARKEDELSPVPFNQSINPSTSPPPGVQFNQSISRLLDDDNLLDCSDKHSSLSTRSLLTRRVSLDRSSGQPVDQSTNQSCEDIHIVGKQVPVRFVIPPAAVESEKSKQHDVSEAAQSIKSLFSPSALSFTQSLDQPIIQPTNQIIDDSEKQGDTNSAQAISPPVTQPVNQPINIKLDSSFRIDKIPAGTVRTYHFAPSAPAVIEDTPLISPDQADQSADTPINSSTNQSTDQVIDKLTEHLLDIPASVTSSPSNQISSDHVGDQLSNQSLDDSINQQIDLAAIQLTPPTPASTPLSDEPASSPDVTPSPPLSDVAHSLVTSGSAPCPDTVDSSGEPAGNMQVDGSLSYAAGDRNSSADLQFQENHRPSLGQTDVASLQASVEERRTIPPSMSQKELLDCLLPRLSPSVEMLSVDVPNEVCVISPQAMAARRLLLAEYAKSPILDVDIKPSADSTLKVDIHPIAKTSKRSRKSKNQRSTTSSPVPLSVPRSNLNASSRSTQSLTPETSKSEPQAKLVTTEQPSDLPEPSEELHEISPKNNDKLSQIDQSQEKPDLKDQLTSENQSMSHSKSEHDIDELSIKTENEIEPRLYSLPNLTSYHPTDEWSPDAERERTEIPDTHKLYDDSSDITDTHDNALLGLEPVVVESKRYIPKKLASPPPQSSTQDEEAFWRMQAEEYAFEYPRTAVTFVHSICAQSTAMRLLFVLSLVLNIVAPLILFLHANEAQITIMCQILAFSCAYWVYAKYDFVTAVFASQALLLPSILFIYESFVKETSLLEFIAVLGTYMTSPRMWWDTSLLCYLWLWASLALQVICLVGGSTIAFRGRA